MDAGHTGHSGDHGVSDCHHAVDNHNHANHTFADNVAHYINSNLHGSHGNVYSSPSSLGDVAQSGINAYGATQQMNAVCGSGE